MNGIPTNEFPLERGLRQGDPLSPFLFMLVVECFNVIMDALVTNNIYTGYKVGGADGVSISHLQFADDIIILGEKSWANLRAMWEALHIFAAMSGLKVNFHKSLLVGIHVCELWLHEAASVLRCMVGNLPFVYLGLPILGGGGDYRRQPLLTRIKRRLYGWKSRHLSFGGRMILLKSIMTSFLVYSLSFFKEPSCVISSIELFFFFLGGVGKLGKFLRLIGRLSV